MGMFDKPKYLTGKDGFVEPGETFWLHNARPDGTVNVNGKPRDQVKLQVSHDRDGEKVIVYTSGAGIVGQVKRMTAEDKLAMPMQIRLDEVPSREGNPTRVLTPASEDPPAPTQLDTGETDW